MITIKDFKVGDVVYALLSNRGRHAEPIIAEKVVVTVGRKYVTTNNDEKYENFDREYLHEVVKFGESRMLFKTKQDAEHYIEKCDLALWLGCISVNKAEKYSLEQLRLVKKILTEDN